MSSKTKRSEAPYQTQTTWCLLFTTDGGRVCLRVVKRQPGGQLGSCRCMLTWCGRRRGCYSGARQPALFPRDRAVTHGRRSAESPGCSPDGHCWATPAPIGERVSAEMRDACDARARVHAGARQRPRSLLPTLGIRSEAEYFVRTPPVPDQTRAKAEGD